MLCIFHLIKFQLSNLTSKFLFILNKGEKKSKYRSAYIYIYPRIHYNISHISNCLKKSNCTYIDKLGRFNQSSKLYIYIQRSVTQIDEPDFTSA